MQNKWKKAGCIRRAPDSQSCQPRNDAWMRSPASVCVRPAASRAAFTCSGVGFLAALPARLRLGWFTILSLFSIIWRSSRPAVGAAGITMNRKCETHSIAQNVREIVISTVPKFSVCVTSNLPHFSADCAYFDCHFISPATVPEARCLRCADDSHYTRIAYKVNNYFTTCFRAQNQPSNRDS